MPRRRNPSRVLGPYPKRSTWRLVFCDEGGAESYVTYETKEEAEQVEKALQRQLKREAIPTLAFALEEYETYLREVKQNKPQSVKTTLFRLRTFFSDQEMKDLLPVVREGQEVAEGKPPRGDRRGGQAAARQAAAAYR